MSLSCTHSFLAPESAQLGLGAEKTTQGMMVSQVVLKIAAAKIADSQFQ